MDNVGLAAKRRPEARAFDGDPVDAPSARAKRLRVLPTSDDDAQPYPPGVGLPQTDEAVEVGASIDGPGIALAAQRGAQRRRPTGLRISVSAADGVTSSIPRLSLLAGPADASTGCLQSDGSATSAAGVDRRSRAVTRTPLLTGAAGSAPFASFMPAPPHTLGMPSALSRLPAALSAAGTPAAARVAHREAATVPAPRIFSYDRVAAAGDGTAGSSGMGSGGSIGGAFLLSGATGLLDSAPRTAADRPMLSSGRAAASSSASGVDAEAGPSPLSLLHHSLFPGALPVPPSGLMLGAGLSSGLGSSSSGLSAFAGLTSPLGAAMHMSSAMQLQQLQQQHLQLHAGVRNTSSSSTDGGSATATSAASASGTLAGSDQRRARTLTDADTDMGISSASAPTTAQQASTMAHAHAAAPFSLGLSSAVDRFALSNASLTARASGIAGAGGSSSSNGNNAEAATASRPHHRAMFTFASEGGAAAAAAASLSTSRTAGAASSNLSYGASHSRHLADDEDGADSGEDEDDDDNGVTHLLGPGPLDFTSAGGSARASAAAGGDTFASGRRSAAGPSGSAAAVAAHEPAPSRILRNRVRWTSSSGGELAAKQPTDADASMNSQAAASAVQHGAASTAADAAGAARKRRVRIAVAAVQEHAQPQPAAADATAAAAHAAQPHVSADAMLTQSSSSSVLVPPHYAALLQAREDLTHHEDSSLGASAGIEAMSSGVLLPAPTSVSLLQSPPPPAFIEAAMAEVRAEAPLRKPHCVFCPALHLHSWAEAQEHQAAAHKFVPNADMLRQHARGSKASGASGDSEGFEAGGLLSAAGVDSALAPLLLPGSAPSIAGLQPAGLGFELAGLMGGVAGLEGLSLSAQLSADQAAAAAGGAGEGAGAIAHPPADIASLVADDEHKLLPGFRLRDPGHDCPDCGACAVPLHLARNASKVLRHRGAHGTVARPFLCEHASLLPEGGGTMQCGKAFATIDRLRAHAMQVHGVKTAKSASASSAEPEATAETRQATAAPTSSIAAIASIASIVVTDETQEPAAADARLTAAAAVAGGSHAHRQHVCSYSDGGTTCGKAFPTAAALRDHVNAHLGARPHVCVHCGTGFSAASNLRRHVVSKHPQWASGTASLSGQAATAPGAGGSGASAVAGDAAAKRLHCPFCSTGFTRSDNLNRHMRQCSSAAKAAAAASGDAAAAPAAAALVAPVAAQSASELPTASAFSVGLAGNPPLPMQLAALSSVDMLTMLTQMADADRASGSAGSAGSARISSSSAAAARHALQGVGIGSADVSSSGVSAALAAAATRLPAQSLLHAPSRPLDPAQVSAVNRKGRVSTGAPATAGVALRVDELIQPTRRRRQRSYDTDDHDESSDHDGEGGVCEDGPPVEQGAESSVGGAPLRSSRGSSRGAFQGSRSRSLAELQAMLAAGDPSADGLYSSLGAQSAALAHAQAEADAQAMQALQFGQVQSQSSKGEVVPMSASVEAAAAAAAAAVAAMEAPALMSGDMQLAYLQQLAAGGGISVTADGMPFASAMAAAAAAGGGSGGFELGSMPIPGVFDPSLLMGQLALINPALSSMSVDAANWPVPA